MLSDSPHFQYNARYMPNVRMITLIRGVQEARDCVPGVLKLVPMSHSRVKSCVTPEEAATRAEKILRETPAAIQDCVAMDMHRDRRVKRPYNPLTAYM